MFASPEVRLRLSSCFPNSQDISAAVPLEYSEVRKAAGLPTEQHNNNRFKRNGEPGSAMSDLENRKLHAVTCQ